MLNNRLAVPVSGASLGVVRVVFGLVGVVSMVRIVAYGWVQDLYAGPARRFAYPGFGWVPRPDVAGTYLLVAVVGLAALAVMLGWRYRIAIVVFVVGFTWIELLDATTYLNHYWFVTLLGLAMTVAPMDARFAVGGAARSVRTGWIWLVRAHVAVVYVFAGVAKLHADWLVHAMPLRVWLPARADLPVIGPLLAEPWTATALSWAGAVFDCCIVALLLWSRTRAVAWVAVVAFHVATWLLFPIGVFPWLMIGATTAFFEPDWPDRLRERVRRPRPAVVDDAAAVIAPTPAVGAVAPLARWQVGLGLAWVVTLVLVPLRHHLVPGDARWTNEAYRFSWNVLLTEKGADVRFLVSDPATGDEWVETAHDLYTPLQWRTMASDPELIRQAAHVIADLHAGSGRRVEVRADAFVSLNGRPAQRLVDPDVDLGHEPYRPGGQPWILPAPSGPPP